MVVRGAEDQNSFREVTRPLPENKRERHPPGREESSPGNMVTDDRGGREGGTGRCLVE